MTFPVALTDEAEQNIRTIRDWIQERSPDGALRWIDAFEDAKNRLAHNPFSCCLAPEDEHTDRELRNIFFKTRRGRQFRAIFFVEDELVTVTHIRGPSQQLLPPDAFRDV
jgi:plasmid stabilization system protein ParE